MYQLQHFDPHAKDPHAQLSNGIYLDVPEEVYFSHPALSNSGMKLFDVTPAHFRGAEKAETQAQSFGKVAHCAILEPDMLEARYLPSKASRVGTKEWDADVARAAGRAVVKQAEYDDALRLRDAVLGRPGPLRDLIEHRDTIKEFAFFWQDPLTGVDCRGKADGALLTHGVAFDIKSCEDANEAFMRSVRDYRYHWQRAFYTDGLGALDAPIDSFLFFAIEKNAPFEYRTWELPQWLVETASSRYRETLERYAECLKTDTWPGYPVGIETLPFPEAWATYKR